MRLLVRFAVILPIAIVALIAFAAAFVVETARDTGLPWFGDRTGSAG